MERATARERASLEAGGGGLRDRGIGMLVGSLTMEEEDRILGGSAPCSVAERCGRELGRGALSASTDFDRSRSWTLSWYVVEESYEKD